MNIDANDFVNNHVEITDNDYLLVSCKEPLIVPPISVIKNNKSLIKDFDYSDVDMEKYRFVKDITFTNHFVKSLPNNLVILNDLEYLCLSYGINVDLDKELSKLSKLKSLKELDVSLSLIEERDFLTIENRLPNVEVIR